MKPKNILISLFPELKEAFEERLYNPLELFLKSGRKGVSKAKTDALQKCLDNELSFRTEEHTTDILATWIMKIYHPITGNEMKYVGCSMNSHYINLHYRDEQTKDEIHINLPSDAILVAFNEEK